MRIAKLWPALAGLALVGAGCGGDSGGGGPTTFPTSSDPSGPIPAQDLRELNLVLASSDFVAGPNNMAFALTDDSDQPVVVENVKATFYFQVDGTNFEPVAQVEAVHSAPGVGEEAVHVHADGSEHVHGGEAANRGVYYAHIDFDRPGFWGLLAEGELDGEPVTANVGFSVQEESPLLVAGDKAYLSDNLTKDDVDDIREIDSSPVPNDMHDVTIREAIDSGRPVMIVFSTPAFCQTRFCGPITDEVAELKDDYAGRVDFVHIEIWRDFDAQILNPTAAEWLQRPDGSLTEPWVYLVDSEGTVYDRWEGAMDRTVMEPSLKAVADGATFGAN